MFQIMAEGWRVVDSGHEVMMDRCWLGETNFDFDHVQHGVAPNATAIQINGNDHYILVRSNPSLLLCLSHCGCRFRV